MTDLLSALLGRRAYRHIRQVGNVCDKEFEVLLRLFGQCCHDPLVTGTFTFRIGEDPLRHDCPFQHRLKTKRSHCFPSLFKMHLKKATDY